MIIYLFSNGRAVARQLDAGFSQRRPGFKYKQHVGFVVDKAALGRFSPSTSVSLANHSTEFSVIIITWGWHNRPLCGRSLDRTLIPPTSMQIKKKITYFLQYSFFVFDFVLFNSFNRQLSMYIKCIYNIHPQILHSITCSGYKLIKGKYKNINHSRLEFACLNL
jgi:hypothetical protein